MTRRSTQTIMVLSPLSLTTVPCRIRLGIAALSSSACAAACCAEHGLDARDVAAHLAHARRALELAGGLLEAQVELLLLQLQELVLQLIGGLARADRSPSSRRLLDSAARAARTACRSAAWQRPAGSPRCRELLGTPSISNMIRPGFTRRDPELDRALALAHADFGRLLGHRHVREDPDPDAAGALEMAGDRAAGRLDLARGDPAGSTAFMPKAPKLRSVPPFARPWIRPLKALRNLVRFGCIMTGHPGHDRARAVRRADSRPAACRRPSGRAP